MRVYQILRRVGSGDARERDRTVLVVIGVDLFRDRKRAGHSGRRAAQKRQVRDAGNGLEPERLPRPVEKRIDHADTGVESSSYGNRPKSPAAK
jgi:hypothetical protein